MAAPAFTGQPVIDSAAAESQRRRSRTGVVVTLTAFLGFAAEGYALAIFGATVPRLMLPSATSSSGDTAYLFADPLNVGQLGVIGAYFAIGALIGVLVGEGVRRGAGPRATAAIGVSILAIGMVITGIFAPVSYFAVGRFLAGVGAGAMAVGLGAALAEYGPPRRRALGTAIAYAGLPAGALLALLLAAFMLPRMTAPTSDQASAAYWLWLLGAFPLLTVLPLTLILLPASINGLVARGQWNRAQRVSRQTGIPVSGPSARRFNPAPGWPTPPAGWTPPVGWRPDPSWPAYPPGWQFWVSGDVARVRATGERPGWSGLFNNYLLSTLAVSLVSGGSFAVLFAWNTWLPRLLQPLVGPTTSLVLVAFMNVAAVLGVVLGGLLGTWVAPKWLCSASLFIGGLATGGLALLFSTVVLPSAADQRMGAVSNAGPGVMLGVWVALVLMAGAVGALPVLFASLLTGLRSNVQAAASTWAGLGRIGGILGTLGMAILIMSGLRFEMLFWIVAAFTIVLGIGALFLPSARRNADQGR